jgi:hypothetical protein
LPPLDAQQAGEGEQGRIVAGSQNDTAEKTSGSVIGTICMAGKKQDDGTDEQGAQKGRPQIVVMEVRREQKVLDVFEQGELQSEREKNG